MAFHFSLLGPVSAKLQRYSDGDGFVPQANDRWQDFHWNRTRHKQFGDPHSGEAYWHIFIAQATDCTVLAFQKLQDMEWWH